MYESIVAMIPQIQLLHAFHHSHSYSLVPISKNVNNVFYVTTKKHLHLKKFLDLRFGS